MTTLYNLTAEFQNAFEKLSFMLDAGDQLTEAEFADNMAGFDFEYDSKIEACGMFAKNMESEIDQLKNFKAEIDNRIKALTKKSDAFKDYIRFNMESVGKKQVKTPFITVNVGKRSESLNVIDSSLIPADFKKVEVVEQVTILNADIKKALQAGAEVAGAELVLGKPSLTIKV